MAKFSKVYTIAAKERKELRDKIDNWKKHAWLDFCKLVMEADTTYTLLPLSDYNDKQGNHSMLARVDKANGVFSNFCLTKTGTLSDIYILPCEPMLGIMIDAGSKYSRMTLQAFPSKAAVWPIIKLAEELERQYVREVSIESNKHGKVK